MSGGYADFLARKARHTVAVGAEVDPGDLHPKLYDFQRDGTAWAIRTGRAALFWDCGLGKAQPDDEPVLTPYGWVRIDALAIGDQVIGPDGCSRDVVGVFPQGSRECFRVTFDDGASTRCDGDHLWTVMTDNCATRDRGWRTIPLRQILAEGLAVSRGRPTLKWRIPVTAPIQLPELALPIDPYVLGALIGDGHLAESGVTLTSIDEGVLTAVGSRLPQPMRLARTSEPITYRLSLPKAGTGHRNPVMVGLRELDLMGRLAHEKHIPEPYLCASASQRLELLRGLMDTDGYVSRDGCMQFSTSSAQLRTDVVALVRGLGGIARSSSKVPRYKHRGECRFGRLHHTVTMRLPKGVVPFRLQRKIDRVRSDPRWEPIRKIAHIESVGALPARCIKVAAADGLYLTADHVVTHNTFAQAEWAKRSADTSLIVAPLSVARQTVREAQKIDIEISYVRSGDAATGAGIWITNYEMVEHFDPSLFGAVVLDESSILKSLDGKLRTRLIEMFRSVPSRLACTATPAPNDTAELTNHAEFLGLMSRAEMLAAYFVNDEREWRLKGHATGPMYRWMASWAQALRRPSDLGYSDDGFDLPELSILAEPVDVPMSPDGQLFATDLGGIGGRSKVRRETLAARVERAAELAQSADQWIVWCGLNDEARELAAISGAVNVEGNWSPDAKAEALEAFQEGEIRVLVSKPSICGFGMNFQNCSHMAFVGLSDSYESYYQAIRRCWRFGQTEPVDAHIIVSDLEMGIVENVRRKEREAARMTDDLIAAQQSREPVAA